MRALGHAENAVELYREAGDSRGLVRALSQVAQQMANAVGTVKRKPRPMKLYTSHVPLTTVPFSPRYSRAARTQPSRARSIRLGRGIARASTLFRSLGRDSGRGARAHWWAGTEAVEGRLTEAARIIDEALRWQSDGWECGSLRPRSRYTGRSASGSTRFHVIRQALFLRGRCAHPLFCLSRLVSCARRPRRRRRGSRAAHCVCRCTAANQRPRYSRKSSAERSMSCEPR